MIVEYQRPKTIQDALSLLSREHPISLPLGGGTILNQDNDLDYAVIDLQDLGLDSIKKKGNLLHIGATASLQELLCNPGLPGNLLTAIEYEATYNLRQVATVAGTIASAKGFSPFVTSLLALDAGLEIKRMNEEPAQVKIGNWLPLRNNNKPNGLITSVQVAVNVQFQYEYVARTPADKPIICVAVALWKSGRTRLALGGYGNYPIIAIDGPSLDGIAEVAKNAYSNAGDVRASAEYRREMAGLLATRCIHDLQSM